MQKILGLVGEVAPNGECRCKNCNTLLRNDHGFYLEDGTAICRETVRCNHIAYKNNQQPSSAKRWRKQ